MMKAARRRAVQAAQKRAIHSVYGGFANQGAGDMASMMNWGSCRGSIHTHFKEDDTIQNFTSAGKRFASSLRHDRERLLASDWTTDFSGFWADQVAMHEAEFVNLYEGGVNTIIGSFTSLKEFTPEEKELVKKELTYLKVCYKWANKANEVYTHIFDERFRMQRSVFDAVEREKILASCTELVENFAKVVPSEFRGKATKDVEWHLYNLRHYVWDAPATKAAFKRTMN